VKGRSGSLRSGTSVEDLHRLVAYHRALLQDGTRNRAFRAALARRVRPGADVLDIGAGTGVWAVTAAVLGARRVVAVEKEPLLLPLIEAAARENGVASRVVTVCGDSRRLRLSRRFDVVVSETIGNEAFDEDVVPILEDARRRFVRPGGTLIPSLVSLMAAPARVGRQRLPAGVALRWSFFESLAVHFPPSAGTGLRLLGRPAVLARADLMTSDLGRVWGAGTKAQARTLAARWRVRDRRAVDGFAVWPEADLAPGVRLVTLRGTAWRPRLYPTEPLPAGPGEVSFRLFLDPPDRRWEVGHRGVTSVYSPLFAFGALRPRLGGLTMRSMRARGR
jgi:protein arginine N-methyltransferase 1